MPYKLNLSFIARPVQDWELAWDNYFRWKPGTDKENALFNGSDADDWVLSNLTISHDRALNIKNLKLTLSIRNIFDEEYGHVDPRTTISPGTPFLASYHPQESRNALLGIHYRYQ